MGVLDTAFGVGDDALAYEFEISIGPLTLFADPTGIIFRATTVEIPEVSVGEYEFDYKSEKIVKPNGKITTPKEFSIEFRIDKYWKVYQAFKLWNNAIVNPDTGGVATDSNNGNSLIRTPITITTGTTNLDGNFIPTTQIWAFTGCWPKRVGGFSMDNNSGEPLLTSITFGFLKML